MLLGRVELFYSLTWDMEGMVQSLEIGDIWIMHMRFKRDLAWDNVVRSGQKMDVIGILKLRIWGPLELIAFYSIYQFFHANFFIFNYPLSFFLIKIMLDLWRVSLINAAIPFPFGLLISDWTSILAALFLPRPLTDFHCYHPFFFFLPLHDLIHLEVFVVRLI
jgi:hypothetical protein